MAGPIAPNTLAVLQEWQAKATALLLADGVTLAYQTVVVGAQKDYTEIPLPCLTLIVHGDDSKRHAHGGTILDHTEVEFRSIVDYSDTSTAEIQILAIRDALMPLLEKYATFDDLPVVYDMAVKPNSAAFLWMFLKPNWYRVHTVLLTVAQYYVISGGIQ